MIISKITLGVLIIFGFFLCIALVVISSHLEDLSSDIIYIKTWVSTNTTDITIAIDKAKTDLMVELACVGAKNNADIQRIKDGFQDGDVIELGDVRYIVTKRILKMSGSLAGYMVVRKDGASEYWEIEDIGAAKFIKHLDGFEEAFVERRSDDR